MNEHDRRAMAAAKAEAKKIVEQRGGCKATELCAEGSLVGLPAVEAIEELVSEGGLVEVEYIRPDMPYRIKSFLLPAGSEVRIRSGAFAYRAGAFGNVDASRRKANKALADQIPTDVLHARLNEAQEQRMNFCRLQERRPVVAKDAPLLDVANAPKDEAGDIEKDSCGIA